MEITESTEHAGVLTVCKEGGTCDVDAKENDKHFMGRMGGAGWIQKTIWFGRR